MSLVSRLPLDHPYRWDATSLGFGKLWRPEQIGSSLLAWYDAADAASFSFGTGVSQWRDISGNGLHLDQSIGANQPTRNATGLANLPTVEFDGSNDALLSNPSTYPWPAAQAQPFTVIAVTKPPAYASLVNGTRLWSSFRRNFGGSLNSWSFDYYAFAGVGNSAFQIAYSAATFGADDIYNGSGIPIQKDNIVLSALEYNGFSSMRRMYGSAGGTTGNSQFYTLYGLCLGADGYNGTGQINHSATSFSEMIVCSALLPTAIMERVEGYLAWKWRCEDGLAAGHPYKNSPPTA